MQSSVKRVILLAALAVALGVAPAAFAQEYEIHPYAGGLAMSSYNSTLNFKNPAVFGLKGGAFVTDHLMIEGNAGWMNQLNFGGYDYRTGGILYEGAVNYNFYQLHMRGGVVPFVSFGVGGITVKTRDGVNMNDHNQSLYIYPLNVVPSSNPFPKTIGTLLVHDNDSFMNFSYGGGVRGTRLWGPMGLRADIRGRTMPDFYGTKINSLEATGGLLFSWGER